MTLTYEKLQELIDEHSTPFVAYTCSPSCYNRLLAKNKRKEKPSSDSLIGFDNGFCGLEVWNVPQQSEPCIEWKDKRLMMLYLEGCGVINRQFECPVCEDTGYFQSILDPKKRIKCGCCKKPETV